MYSIDLGETVHQCHQFNVHTSVFQNIQVHTSISLYAYGLPDIYFFPQNSRYADRWISEVYKPNFFEQMENVSLRHTMESGTRYKKTKRNVSEVILEVKSDVETLNT